ncbi:ribonuclease P protein component [Candidatus Bandiella euplotis]|uniref:ribonuclease P protein component n=1 Tax=Candidatus Bandiella euplotis TaxID=1664265 RepID=UPI002B263092|nr:ribonuclease P protein component [Candidatus Bandiella woodruffii]
MKDFKITKKAEYQKLFSEANKVISKYFIVLYQPPEPSELRKFRYGITASKKVGNAVERNRCKRIVRVLMKDICARAIDENINININVIARKFVTGKSFSSIKSDFMFCLNKIFSNERRSIKDN